jgi:hypothetical protein
MRSILVLCTVIVSTTVTMQGQVPPAAQRAATDLSAIPTAAATATQELTVRWTPYPGATSAVIAPDARPASAAFLLLERRSVPGELRRLRSPQLSSDQLVAIGVDAAGRESDWQLVKDPRIIRAEGAGADGRLSGQVLHRTDAEFLLTVPAGNGFTSIRIYETAWTGSQYVLRYVGAIALDQPAVR